jgi:hypothetical protein
MQGNKLPERFLLALPWNNTASFLGYLLGLIVLLPIDAIAIHYDKDQKQLLIMGGSNLGVRYIAKQDAEIAFNALLDEKIDDPYYRLHVALYPSTQEVYAAFDRGEIDGIFGSPLEYLGRADQLGEKVMALTYRGGSIMQSFVLVARRSEDSNELTAFRNKRLTLSKMQDLEELYLNTLLLRHQLPEIPGFFSARLDAKNANVALMDVFFNKSDITIVRESEFQTAVELNPQLSKRLIILDQSAPFLPVLGSPRKGFDEEKIKILMKRIQAASNNDTGTRQLLSQTQANSIVNASRDDLRSVYELLQEYNALKQKRKSVSLPTGKSH